MCPFSAYRVWASTRIPWGPEAESKSLTVSNLLYVQIVPLQEAVSSYLYLQFAPRFEAFLFLTAISSPHQILSPLLQLATEIPNISQCQLCWTRWQWNTCAMCKDFTCAGCKSGVSGYFKFIGELIWLEDTVIWHVQHCFICSFACFYRFQFLWARFIGRPAREPSRSIPQTHEPSKHGCERMWSHKSTN